ncbi:non-homologous end-joining factor 1 [Etheostoma spectabile]|uniref:non-homologous end-joining factor 1 n=1 Tax=Etheostoma spectabile TaxID=54343 RepID=UPI0013AF3B68|nr:non-homologous end-joining factor 1 [Etheostoma spectabile]
MEPGGASPDVLLQRPWLPVSIGGCRLLAKTWFGETAYHILLTDVQCVWEERMDSADLQTRSQELNRRLRAPVQAFFSHLREVVQPSLTGSDPRPDNEALMSLTRRDDGDIRMKLKSELAGLPFYWEFHCTPAPVTVVCVGVCFSWCAPAGDEPPAAAAGEQLGGLLRKETQRSDYRENGATLSRARLQTDVFEEQTYREDFMSKTLPSVLLSRRTAQLDAAHDACTPRRCPRKGTGNAKLSRSALLGRNNQPTQHQRRRRRSSPLVFSLYRSRPKRQSDRPPNQRRRKSWDCSDEPSSGDAHSDHC